MTNPMVSIIVASYNQGRFLNECMKSVFQQSYTNWECIVVDDASSDDSQFIAETWIKSDHRFRIISLPSNKGVSHARNIGISDSKGQYFQFLDADDLLEPNKIAHQVQCCQEDLIPVSGNRYFNDREGPDKQRIFGKNGALPEVPITRWDQVDLLLLFKSRNPFIVSAPLFPISVKDRVGLLNENLKAFEDWEFNFRCALAGYKFHHVGYAEKAQVLVRLHPASMTTNTQEMLQRRREFNFEMANNKDYQRYFGRQVSMVDSPFFQYLNTFIRSLVPPLIFTLVRKFRR